MLGTVHALDALRQAANEDQVRAKFPSGDSTGTVFPAYVIIGARWKAFVEINRELLTVYLPKALGIREVVPARSKFSEAMLEPTVRSSQHASYTVRSSKNLIVWNVDTPSSSSARVQVVGV